jgi:signal transduction histidine kinase
MRRSTLVFRLVLLSATAVIFPALIISIVHRSVSSNALQASIQQHQTELARRMAEEVNMEVLRAQGLVALVARSSNFSAGSRVDQYEALHNLLAASPALQEVSFVSSEGVELVKTYRAGGRPELIRRSVDLKKSLIGAPFFSGNRAPTILLSEPVRTFSNPIRTGVVVAKMSFTSLNKLLTEANIGRRGTAFIVNERGMILGHPNLVLVHAHTNVSSLPVIQSWMKRPGASTKLFEYTDAGGQEVVGLAHPIPLLRSAVVVQQPKRDVYAPLDKMRRQFILYAFLSVVLVLGLAIAIAWRILHPLRQLRAAAEQVGRGDLDVKLDIHTRDELEDLGRTFEQMAKSLSELERMRGDLINMIVHDLKMPLSTIMPSLDCLLIGEAGPITKEQKHFVQMARRAGQEMLMMIQNLLDVAKMEEGKLSLDQESFLPSDWASSVIANFKPLAEGGHKRLDLVLEKTLPTMRGDIALLSRVLGNLISNALRHTPPGTGEVTVSLYRDGTQLAVEVRDNGEGIPEEEQQRIFEKFVQGDGKRAPVRLGSGLGLTFCKMVVEAHQGRIHVFSQPQAGSLFTFHLPIPEPDPTVPGTAAPESGTAEAPRTPQIAPSSTD